MLIGFFELATASLKNLKSRSKLKKTKGDAPNPEKPEVNSESEPSEKAGADDSPSKALKEKKVSVAISCFELYSHLSIFCCYSKKPVRVPRKKVERDSPEASRRTFTPSTSCGLT